MLRTPPQDPAPGATGATGAAAATVATGVERESWVRRLIPGRVDRYARWALALGAVGVALRIAGLAAGVPATNSDEATMGLMARHIVTEHAFPVFFYGQEYMGALEAYLAAPLFWLFGSSTMLLRLQTFVWYGLLCWAMYRLSVRLYGKRVAVATLVLLAAASDRVIQNELRVGGGYPEIVPLTAVLMLGAVYLAQTTAVGRLSVDPRPSEPVQPSTGRQSAGVRPSAGRLAAFAGWGFVAGLALWDHWIVLPYLAAGGVLLVLFCGRELRSGAAVSLAVGAALGAFPLLWQNVTGRTNSVEVFRNLTKSDGLIPGIDNLYGGILTGVPLTAGLCPSRCSPIQSWWGVAYLLLLAVAAGLAGAGLWSLRRQPRRRTAMVRQAGRTALVVAAAVTIASYIRNYSSADTPDASARYLALLAVSMPAIAWPVLAAPRIVARVVPRLAPAARVLRAALVTATVALLATATVATFVNAPAARADEADRHALADALERLHVRYIFTDYWTCNRIAFATLEHIQCAVLDDDLTPGQDRYLPYVRRVADADRLAYAFPARSPQRAAFDARIAAPGADMRRLEVGGYVIYYR